MSDREWGIVAYGTVVVVLAVIAWLVWRTHRRLAKAQALAKLRTMTLDDISKPSARALAKRYGIDYDRTRIYVMERERQADRAHDHAEARERRRRLEMLEVERERRTRQEAAEQEVLRSIAEAFKQPDTKEEA